MSIKRWSAKRDATEAEIIAALRKAGCHIIQLDKFDILVLTRKATFMLEVKSKGGRLKPSQKLLIEQGWPLHIVHTTEEALKAVGL